MGIVNTVTGSNNLTLPLKQRVRLRLQELRDIGKTKFQKGENKEFNEIPAELPIDGPIDWYNCVTKVSDDEYTLSYKTYKCEKDKDGVPRPVRKLVKVGEGDMGMMHKLIDKVVTETFKKNKPFTRKEDDYEGNPVSELMKDEDFRSARKSIITGGSPESE